MLSLTLLSLAVEVCVNQALYHSFACSRVSYGIIARGTSADKYLKEVGTKLNNTKRAVTWNKKFSRATQLYKYPKLLKLREVCNLKLREVYNLELAKFMHQQNNKIPLLFQNEFANYKKYIHT